MKSFLKKMVATVSLVLTMVANVEAQNSFAYQAVIRTAKGELVSNKEIAMQFSLIYDGKVIYCETQKPTTNQYGNVQVEVGKGQKVSGSFADVPWSTMQVMMKIEADPNGGTNYIDLGTIQLQPAPYAMYAPAAGKVTTIQAGDPKSDSNALFEVKDKDGNVVFAVYPEGVRVFVDDSDSTITKAISTGFAVSGRKAAKEGEEVNIFAVNAQGTQVFVNEEDTAGGKAMQTGFAVSGRKAAKDGSDLFTVGSTGTQVYIDEDATKAVRTGFAVSGRRGGAKDADKYLEINTDGTHVYIDNEDDSTKAVRTGFAVSGRRGGAKDAAKYMEINADGTKVYVGADGKAIKTGFAVSGRRGGAKGKEIKLFEVNNFGTQIYIDAENDKAIKTGFAVSGRRGAAKDGNSDSNQDKYMVIDADGTVIYVDYEAAKAMQTGFAVSGRKAAKDGTQNTILKVDNAEGTHIYIEDVDGKVMPTGFAVSGRKAAKDGESDLMRITGDKTTITAKNLGMQDKESDKSMMSITSDSTKIFTGDLQLLNHNDSTLLTTNNGNVEVMNDLVVLGDVAQTVDADTVEDVLPIYMAVVERIDTIVCADTAPGLQAAKGYALLKIYGNGLFAQNQNIDAEGNNVILFDANGNPIQQHQAAAAAVILAKASTADAKLIVWPLKQVNNLKICFGLMAAGDTANRYVNVEAYVNASAPVECLVDVKAEVDSLGTVVVNGPKVYGEKVDLVPQPIEGYHFTKWADGRRANPRTALILHDTAFASANFEINTYNIIAKAKNGKVEISGPWNADTTFNHGSKITLKAIPFENHHFMGWSDGDTAKLRQFTIKSDTTFEALFAIDSFNIKLQAKNGMVAGEGVYPYGTEIEISATADTAAGYHFVNWSDNIDDNPRKLTVTENLELTANFAINTYALTYKVDGEIFGDVETVEYGAPLTLRDSLVKEGYTFSGWSAIPETMPKNNVTVTGSWSINQYTITFKSDTNVVYTTVKQDYNTAFDMPKEEPVKTGYTFKGWSDTLTTIPAKDTTITAKWEINQYTVTFADSTGRVFGSVKANYNTELKAPTNADSTGYTFKGWQNLPTTIPAKDSTVLGKWTVNQYTVTFGPATEGTGTVTATVKGQTVASGSKVDYGTVVTLTATPADGYFFIRWSDGVTATTRTITKDTTVNAIFKNEFIANGLKYTLTSASTVSVGKIDDDNKPTGELNIPATVNDGEDTFSVTAVSKNGFKECSGLTSVIVSAGITNIDYCAFRECSNLASVSLPDGLTNIEEAAFLECINLETINLPDGLTSIGSESFMYCEKLTSVTFPATLTTLGSYAFHASGLTTVKIPSGLTTIGGGPFSCCANLIEITVDAENKNFVVENGVLYNKDKTRLLQYPVGKTETQFVVPDGVTSIETFAIAYSSKSYSSKLKNVALPNSVTKIDYNAFFNDYDLETLTLPSNCTTVLEDAFSRCPNLTIYCQAAEAPANTSDAKTVLTNCKAIKVQSSNIESGTVSIQETGGYGADGSTWFAAGTEITLVAEPAEGFELARWTVDGETVASPYTVTKDAVINAEFVRTEVYVQNRVSLFSVGANQTICFAPGNLQYQPITGTWRFAEHQYDRCFESDASNPSAYYNATYEGWIDLFGWGTSGFGDKMPYMYGGNNTDYGDGANDIAGTNYDWGVYNSISGYAPGVWRTPTYSEWRYLMKTRPDADSKYGFATIDEDYPGMVLLPDEWTQPKMLEDFFSGKNKKESSQEYVFENNYYSFEEWALMEAAGAVFLPAAGWRSGSTIAATSVKTSCAYWFATALSDEYAYGLTDANYDGRSFNKSDGNAVRLVRTQETVTANGSAARPYGSIAEAVESLAESQSDIVINIDGTLTGPQTVPASVNGKVRSITIQGKNGNTIDKLDAKDMGTVLTINTTVPVTIKNLKISGGNATNGGGIYCSAGSDVTLDNGAKVAGNIAQEKGGGVYVDGKVISNDTIRGKLTINKLADISDNNVVVVHSSGDDGGAGVYVNYGMMLLNGGEISNNYHGNNSGNGFDATTVNGRGGIRLQYAIFTMRDGKISGNKSGHMGGNIFSVASRIDICGGEISDGVIGYNNSSYDAVGSALLLDVNTVLNMSGGKIIGNKTWAGQNKTGRGAVVVCNTSIFNMSGGTISGNTIESGGNRYGSAVCVIDNGVFNISDSANIASNNDVYLAEGKMITIAGELTAEAPVATITPSNYSLDNQWVCGSKELLASQHTKFAVAPQILRSYTTWYINAEGKLFDGFVSVPGTYFDGAETVATSVVFTAGSEFPIQNMLVCDHEVTQREWETVMGISQAEMDEMDKKDDEADNGVHGIGDNNPAYRVTWYAAIAYCNKRSVDEGLTPVYTVPGIDNWRDLTYTQIPRGTNADTWNAVTCNFDANGYRLPTEAEWEYLARGGNLSNNEQTSYSGSDEIGDVAWYKGNSGDNGGDTNGKTHEVKTKAPNNLVLYDMSGNVWEWCWNSDLQSSTHERHTRGGSWDCWGDHQSTVHKWCNVNTRATDEPYELKHDLGLRVVRTVVSNETCQVTINNGTNPERYYVLKGYYITVPAIPTRAGYIFEGWYSDEECETPYNFKAAVTGDVTLYAKWKKIYAKVGGTFYSDLQSTISAISQVSEDVTIELYGAVKADELGKADEPNTIIYAVKHIQSQIGVTLVVPEGANIALDSDCSNMFSECSNLVSADLRGFNTSGVTNMSYMFYRCSALTMLDVSGFNTANVTNMLDMFGECESLTTLDLSNFNTSNCSNIAAMFENCESLTTLDLSSFNTSKDPQMNCMFQNCPNLTTIYAASGADWSGVGSSNNMFNGCTALEGGNSTKYNSSYIDATYARIDKEGQKGYFTVIPYYAKVGDVLYYDYATTIEAITNASGSTKVVIYKGTAGELGKVGTSSPSGIIGAIMSNSNAQFSFVVPEGANIVLSGDDCENMFAGLNNLISADLRGFNTSSVTNMSAMFWNCPELISLNITNFITNNVTRMDNMFVACYKLTTIDVSSFNTGKVEYMDRMFAACTELTTIYAAAGANWKTSVLQSSGEMFLNSSKLPNYSDDCIDATYARINGGATNKGYFTVKN